MMAMATEKLPYAADVTSAIPPIDYTDQDENGRFYTLDHAQVGWLISECAGGARWPSGDLRTGIITAVRGGGFNYVDAAGNARFAPDRRVYGVARPVQEAQEG